MPGRHTDAPRRLIGGKLSLDKIAREVKEAMTKGEKWPGVEPRLLLELVEAAKLAKLLRDEAAASLRGAP